MPKNEPWLWGDFEEVVRGLLDQGWTRKEIREVLASVKPSPKQAGVKP